MKKILLSFVAIFSLAIVFSSCGTDYSEKTSLFSVREDNYDDVIDQYYELVTDFASYYDEVTEYVKTNKKAPEENSSLVKDSEELGTKIEKFEGLIEDIEEGFSSFQKARFERIKSRFEKMKKLDADDILRELKRELKIKERAEKNGGKDDDDFEDFED